MCDVTAIELEGRRDRLSEGPTDDYYSFKDNRARQQAPGTREFTYIVIAALVTGLVTVGTTGPDDT